MAVELVQDPRLRKIGSDTIEETRCPKCWRRAHYGEDATGPEKCGFGVAWRRHHIGFRCTGYRSLYAKEGF